MLNNISVPILDADRLNKRWSNVTVHNTHGSQTHIVLDRFGQGQTFRPGDKREMAMLDEDIAYFREQRREGRQKYDDFGQVFTLPLHPVVIENVAPLPPANP